MITKLTRLLGNIVGRIKENMESLFFTMGGVLVPLGFYLLVERKDIGGFAFFAIFLGLFCWLFSLLIVRYKEARDNKQRKADRIVTNTLIGEARKDFDTLIQEIRALRQDWKGKEDERRHSDK